MEPEKNFFCHDFEPTKESVNELINKITNIMNDMNIDVKTVTDEFYEDEGYLHNITFVTENKKYRFTYDDSGEPCVDICDNDGKIMTTLHPKDYNEFINLI